MSAFRPHVVIGAEATVTLITKSDYHNNNWDDSEDEYEFTGEGKDEWMEEDRADWNEGENEVDWNGEEEYDWIEEDEDNVPPPWRLTPINLSTFEDWYENKPIFTRSLLLSLKLLRDFIRIQIEVSGSETLPPDLSSIYRYAYRPRFDDPISAQIYYLTAVELHPDFRKQLPYGDSSPKVQALLVRESNHVPGKGINDNSFGSKKLFTPAYVNSFCIDRSLSISIENGDLDHKLEADMTWWRARLWAIRKIWEDSDSRARLVQTFRQIRRSNKYVPIKKIACFALGNFHERRISSSFQGVLQHLAAFTIAETLNSESPSCYPDDKVQVICQDPCYKTADFILLREEFNLICHTSPPSGLRFVEDPDGFLAIDTHTLLMTAHINMDVPLMQICADLPRPAGFICDQMDLDPERQMFDHQERSSPRVIRMLKEYEKRDFDDHAIEEQMFKLCCGKFGYWLWNMEMFLRVRNEPNKTEVVKEVVQRSKDNE